MSPRHSWKHPNPKAWRAASLAVRERSGWRCECAGECGLHRTNPGPRRCIERHGTMAHYMRAKVVLTVAHLNAKDGPCQCDPLCCDPDHLKAMCQRCHLRYDVPRHMENAKDSRDRSTGQRRLFENRRTVAHGRSA